MNHYQRPHSPFEDSAAQRLRRMGLTTEDRLPGAGRYGCVRHDLRRPVF